jgi:hypothetical protein
LRAVLISAISACADQQAQRKARRFLEGLSTDELQYIAEFLGACMLASWECSVVPCGTADRVESRGCLADREHKMILLWECLHQCRIGTSERKAKEAF